MSKLLSFKDEFVSFAKLCKLGNLTTNDLAKIIEKTYSLDDEKDILTALRYVYRYSVIGNLNTVELTNCISQIYFRLYDSETEVFKRHLFWSWFNRYNHSPSKNPFETLIVEKLNKIKNQETLLTCFQMLDGCYDIDFIKNSIKINSSCQTIYTLTKYTFIKKIFNSPRNSEHFSFETISENKFRICGTSNSGGKPSNDDNIATIELTNGETIILLADGSGNSSNANEASHLVISYFLFGYINSLNLDLAIKFASAALRNYNLKNKLDGETTLVVLLINKNRQGRIISIGDSIFMAIGHNSDVLCSPFRPEERWILGCEPIGDVITSSGNLLYNLNKLENIPNICIENLKRFLITSDGVLLTSDNNYDSILRIIKDAQQHIVNKTLIDRALESFRTNETKRDNVSLIYGTIE